MTSVDPVLLFVGFLAVVALWEGLRLVKARARAQTVVGRVELVLSAVRHARPARVAAAAVIALVVIATLAASQFLPALFIPSSQLVSWQLGDGIGGPRFDPKTTQTTRMVAVEIWWPGSAPIPPDTSWLDPIVAYTPWSVTITLRSHVRIGCDSTHLPCVGTYLSPISFPIQLSEPLGGRALFDGSSLPPEARPYP